MFTKIVFGFGSVLAQDQRQLSAGGDAATTDLVEFHMEHETDEGYKYHYANYGDDWGHVDGMADDVNQCGGEDQSPINVMQPIGSYGWAYGLPNPREHDKFDSQYVNLNTDTLIEWDYSSLKFEIHEDAAQVMYFDSKYAELNYNASTSRFIPTHVVFKSPSDHTINGHHMDLEMQIYHKAESWNDTAKIKYGAIAVMFSVEEYDKSIDEVSNKTMQDFFRQLKFEDHEDKIAPSLLIGDVLNSLNMQDRWTYKGGFTEPPCDHYVYWNIVRTIYPVEIDRFALFSDLMYSKKYYLGGKGKNNRKISTVENHFVQYISAHYISATKVVNVVSATLLAYVMLY